jgi:hypothetical protein
MVKHTIYRIVHSFVLLEFVIYLKKMRRVKDCCICPQTLVSNYLHLRAYDTQHIFTSGTYNSFLVKGEFYSKLPFIRRTTEVIARVRRLVGTQSRSTITYLHSETVSIGSVSANRIFRTVGILLVPIKKKYRLC